MMPDRSQPHAAENSYYAQVLKTLQSPYASREERPHTNSPSLTVARYVKTIPIRHSVSILGALDASADANDLIAEYEALFKDFPDQEKPVSMSPLTSIRTKQIARRKNTVAEIELHRDREILTVYLDHEDAPTIVAIAGKRGYVEEKFGRNL